MFITQVLCKRCQAVEGRKQRMGPEHFLFNLVLASTMATVRMRAALPQQDPKRPSGFGSQAAPARGTGGF